MVEDFIISKLVNIVNVFCRLIQGLGEVYQVIQQKPKDFIKLCSQIPNMTGMQLQENFKKNVTYSDNEARHPHEVEALAWFCQFIDEVECEFIM